MPVIRRQPWIWLRGTAAAFVLFGVLAAIAAALALLARWRGGRSAVRKEKEGFIAEKEDKEGEKEDKEAEKEDKEGFTDCKSLTRDGQEVMECGPDRNFPGKLFFHDKSKSSKPSWDPAKGFQTDGEYNGSDPYYLEKIETSPNESSLRLTINDDANESLQIWGNACAAGDCDGAGVKQHHFRADGATAHAGQIVAGYPHAAPWGFNFGLQAFNPVKGAWTRFPWVDGRNYIRGDLQVDGPTNINSSLQVNGPTNVNDGNSDGSKRGINLWHPGDTRFGIWMGETSANGGKSTTGGPVASGDISNHSVRFSTGANPEHGFVFQNSAGKSLLSIKGDDGRTNVYGQLNVKGGNIQTHHVHAPGRQHLSADELLYLLPKAGVVVGKEWGGNGNLSVQGDQTIGGKLCLGGTCISEADIKGFGSDGTSGMTVKGPLVVNEGNNDGSQRGINLWHPGDPRFGIWMGETSANGGKSLNRGGLVADGGISNHSVRFSTGNNPAHGFVFQNSDGRSLLSIKGDDGRTNVYGQLNVTGKVVTPSLQLGDKWLLSGNGDAHGNDFWLRLHNAQDGTNSTGMGNYILKNGAGGNGQLGGVAAGQFWSGNGAYYNGSDRRIKDDIREISAGDVAKFDDLRPVEYTLKADVNKAKQFGLIAQDVESTYPELVRDGPDGIKSINYSQITPLVVAKLQSMGERMQTDQLCVGDVCVTAADLRKLKG